MQPDPNKLLNELVIFESEYIRQSEFVIINLSLNEFNNKLTGTIKINTELFQNVLIKAKFFDYNSFTSIN